MAVEFLIFRVRATAPTPSLAVRTIEAGSGDPAAAQTASRSCYWRGQALDTPIYSAALLKAGDRVAGPAVIEVSTTTIVVPPGYDCVADEFGNHLLERKDAGP